MKKTLLLLFVLLAYQLLTAQNTEILLNETFSGDISSWTIVDLDGDGKSWQKTGIGVDDNASLVSYSKENGITLTPNNWLVSPIIDLAASANDIIQLSYYVASTDSEAPGDIYRVYIKEVSSDSETVSVGDFTKLIYLGTLKKADFTQQTIKLTAYAGKKVRIAFQHLMTTSQSGILLDNVLVEKMGASDLTISTVLSPVSYQALREDIDMAVDVVNKGAFDSKEGYITCQVGDQTFKEVLPSIQAGATFRCIFTQKIPAYTVIKNGETATFTIESANDGNLTNNSTNSTFSVVPWYNLKVWNFETEEQRSQFKNEFTLLKQDAGTLVSSISSLFPNEAAWSMLRGRS